MKSVETNNHFGKRNAAATVLALIPSSFNLLTKPSIERFKLALVNSSLVFFLLSFQVHEKSILLAALPVCCLLSSYPLASVWFLLISVYSLVPLMIKDGLLIPAAATSVIFYVVAENAFLNRYFAHQDEETRIHFKIAFFGSLFGCFCLTAASLFIPPPVRLPDLHTLGNCAFSCAHFVGFAVYFHYKQLTLVHGEEQYSSREKKYQ